MIKPPASSPTGELMFATPANHKALGREAKAGKAVRLARGIYVRGGTLPVADLARHHLPAATATRWPNAVLCGRSAWAAGVADGLLSVVVEELAPTQPLVFPEVEAVAALGPGPLPGDNLLPSGLYLPSEARALVENVDVPGRPPRWRAGSKAVGDWIDRQARIGGPGKIGTLLRQLDVIAGTFDQGAVSTVRRMLRAALGSFDGGELHSAGLQARGMGQGFDPDPIKSLSDLVAALAARAPAPRIAGGATDRFEWLPFFEAYFSNFIEGTEFGVEEAQRIVVDGDVPANRPADAHDVQATYRLVADPAERELVPTTGAELLDILRRRHAILMAARPDKQPGQLKDVPNFAGGHRFVEPDLVVGTIQRGFDVLADLSDPFARSIAMMFLVTECHPFLDGNGRVARITANAELSAAALVRCVIPTVYRNNYLSGLVAVSARNGNGEALASVLDYAQRWTAAVDWTTFDAAHADMEASNAYVDPGVADDVGKRLQLPRRP